MTNTDTRATALLAAFDAATAADRAKGRKDGTVTSALAAMFIAKDQTGDIERALGLALGKIKTQKPSKTFGKKDIAKQFASYKTLANRVADRHGYALKTDAKNATDGFVPVMLCDPAHKANGEHGHGKESKGAHLPAHEANVAGAAGEVTVATLPAADIDTGVAERAALLMAQLSSAARAAVITAALDGMRAADLTKLATAASKAADRALQPAAKAVPETDTHADQLAAKRADRAARKAAAVA